MTTKNILLTTTLSLFTLLSIAMIPNFEAFAEEEKTGYNMVEDVKAVMTFTFRDGVETHEFPVYSMTTDFVSNTGTTFEVQGVIGDAPHLHKALDESYKYRLMIDSPNASIEYNYRYFDVDVDFLRDDNNIGSIGYYNCEILSYVIETLNSNDYESYTSSKSGFAITDEIEFRCGGLNSNNSENMTMYMDTHTDYATVPLDYTFAEGVRSIATFDFETGSERIEFHSFKLDSGFAEGENAGPSFSVERTLDYFPLLGKEIDNARKTSALPSSYNSDFDVNVEFLNSEKVLRNLDFTDCRVTGSEIITQFDKEEGFTGKSGFVLVQQTNFSCAGLNSDNSAYDELRGDVPVWSTAKMYSTQPTHSYNVGTGATALVTFTYKDGIEVLSFPIFDQSNVLDKFNPAFTLEGIVGDFPMLYKRVDENLSLQSVQGSNNVEQFDVDVDLMYGETNVRGFNYSNCRVIDYDVDSDMNKEENYVKGKFALENTFDFECRGYTPNNPVYDAMFTATYAKTQNTNDLRDTDDWGPGFKVE
jgi:hypothetical protein